LFSKTKYANKPVVVVVVVVVDVAAFATATTFGTLAGLGSLFFKVCIIPFGFFAVKKMMKYNRLLLE
jgi:hypothetical protein